MTTPPVSVCSSTTSLALPPNPLSLVFPTTIQPRTIPEEHLETLDQEQPPGDRSPASENDLDFEGTMFIVEKNTIPVCNTDLPSGAELEKRVKNDWLKRRGVEFPAKYTIGSASKSNDGPIGQLISRGKSTSKLPRLQIDPDPTPMNLSSSPISPSKRRFLSLSPLKTIFPPRSPVHQDRATLSAHPSPSSPYSSPSRSLFFRSSSSLATASFLRLPLLSSSGHGKSLSSAHGKSEPLSRQLFKGKGKELAKSPEDLNAWEVVDEDAYENVDKEGNENAGPPRSLMSAVESLHANHADTASSQILTFFDAPRAKQPVSEKIDPWQYMTGLSRAAQETALKDWKGPSSAFIDRPVNRNRSADVIPNCNIGDATTNPTSSVVSLSPGSIESPLPSGPPLTFVRVRAAPPPPPVIVKHTSQVVHPSPLRGTATSNEVDNDKAAVIYQRALDTPLPVTPPFYSADYGGSVAALTLDDLDEGLDLPLSSDIVPARCTLECRDIDSISAHVAQPAHQSSPTVPTTPFTARAVPVEEPMTPTRHHYPGRPLPRPPPTTNRAGVVDSTYAAPEDPRYDPDKTIGSLSTCPEGLLIDLEDTTLDTIPESDSSTPTDEGFFQYPLRLPMSQAQASSSSVNLSADSPSSFCINSIQGSSTPLRSTSPDSIAAHLSSQNTAFSELTDLDLLVSRVAEADPNGSDYEVSSGNPGWKKAGLNKYPDAPPGLGSTWNREPHPARSFIPSHQNLTGTEPQRQYLSHRTY